MDWQPLDTRKLVRDATLYLRLRSGEIYSYFNIPEAQYQASLQAESYGRYSLSHIRGRFSNQHLAYSPAT